MTYYLKYRPQTIDQLDLGDVRESLLKIVKSKRIPHAFLFSGPKGTGKTSAARILAKVVNCESTSTTLRGPGKIEPCGKCRQCVSIANSSNIDIIELDAASHRGIDDIRNLRDAVKLSPASSKKKVYIIDEAHMLTTEASNALLKTLEEPPDHVMFILATTNPEKLISTIRSRATNIVFKKASIEEFVRSLRKVKKGEKLKIDNESLEMIAKASDGSFRDATKILEQLVSEVKSLSAKNVEKFLNKGSSSSINDFIDLLTNRDTKGALSWIEDAIDVGWDEKRLSQEILGTLQTSLKAKFDIGEDSLPELEKHELLRLIELFSQAALAIPGSVIAHLPLDIAVVKWSEEAENSEDTTSATQQDQKVKKNKKKDNSVLDNLGSVEKKRLVITDGESVSDKVWSEIISKIKPLNTSTEALLRASRPIAYDGKKLTLGVYYSFHKEKLEGNPHRDLLEKVIESVVGNHVRVICTLTDMPARVIKGEVVLQEPDQNDLSEFGLVDDNPQGDTSLTDVEDDNIIKIAKDIFEN